MSEMIFAAHMARIGYLLVPLTFFAFDAASATTYDLNLTAVTAKSKTSNFLQPNGEPTTQITWSPLAGLNVSNAVTVSSGDLIEASLTLDRPITVSSTGASSSLGLSFFGGKAAEAWKTAGIVNLYLGNVFVAALQNSGISTTSSTSIGGSVAVPIGKTFTFDNVVSFTNVLDLAAPMSVSQAMFSVLTITPVNAIPEPATAYLFGLGVVVGCGVRCRQAGRAKVES